MKDPNPCRGRLLIRPMWLIAKILKRWHKLCTDAQSKASSWHCYKPLIKGFASFFSQNKPRDQSQNWSFTKILHDKPQDILCDNPPHIHWLVAMASPLLLSIHNRDEDIVWKKHVSTIYNHHCYCRTEEKDPCGVTCHEDSKQPAHIQIGHNTLMETNDSFYLLSFALQPWAPSLNFGLSGRRSAGCSLPLTAAPPTGCPWFFCCPYFDERGWEGVRCSRVHGPRSPPDLAGSGSRRWSDAVGTARCGHATAQRWHYEAAGRRTLERPQ